MAVFNGNGKVSIFKLAYNIYGKDWAREPRSGIWPNLGDFRCGFLGSDLPFINARDDKDLIKWLLALKRGLHSTY